MAHSIGWDAAFEASPVSTDQVGETPDFIRDTRGAVAERIRQEHSFDLTDTLSSNQGKHLPGSARAFVSDDDPDTADTLEDTDEYFTGRFLYRPTTRKLYIYKDETDEWVDAVLDEDGNLGANQLISTVASGTPPLVVASNTLVTNLNADLLDGVSAAISITASTIPVRDNSGRIYIADPLLDTQAATKYYTDHTSRNYEAGSYLYFAFNHTSITATSMSRITDTCWFPYAGTVRVSFSLGQGYDGQGTIRARVYVDGVAVGTLQTTSSTTPTTYTEDFTITAGSSMYIAGYTSNTSYPGLMTCPIITTLNSPTQRGTAYAEYTVNGGSTANGFTFGAFVSGLTEIIKWNGTNAYPTLPTGVFLVEAENYSGFYSAGSLSAHTSGVIRISGC